MQHDETLLSTAEMDAIAPPVFGSAKFTQSVIFASGDSGLPLGLKSSVSGRVKGRSSSLMASGSCNIRHVMSRS